MLPPLWAKTLLGAASLLLAGHDGMLVSAQGSRKAAGPGYRPSTEICPTSCAIAGPDKANWDVYHSLSQLQRCSEPLFYSFSVHDNVDDDSLSYHRIQACTLHGIDFIDDSKARKAKKKSVVNTKTVNYEIGWWSGVSGKDSDLSLLASQLRQYIIHGHGADNKTTMLFARIGMNTAGVYVGQGLHHSTVGTSTLEHIETVLYDDHTRSDIAMQLCGKGYDSDHTFGFMALTNGTFEPIQDAFKIWFNASCITNFKHSQNFTTQASFTSPTLDSIKGSVNSSSVANNSTSSKFTRLSARGDCRTTKVVQGDSCAVLAQRCGISGADFTKYNSKSGFCSSLMPGQYVCCSSGTLPDYRPKPNGDGSCATTSVDEGQSCSTVAAANQITVSDIESFNKNTWGWNGCKNVWAGTVICVSKGTPPMPAPMANAVCGPQVPGTKPPSDNSKLAELNPCPLKACCDVWGQCGTTEDFCKDTSTGAPGTAKPGTNGCISNCGSSMIRGDPPAEFRSIGYYEGYNFNRKCLYQDPSQIDQTKYTHLHFGFGDISANYDIYIRDPLVQYAFERFKTVRGPKRILSFGGWDFSTSAATYTIFRDGVSTPENRMKLATNIVNFVNAHGLDGVDIDWEYPSAPDIPGIPAGSKEEGQNYLYFLVVLRNLLKGKSLSIAAPASFWYLKGFPIAEISKIVDYIIYMTYDLHGQWDAGNIWSQPNCPSGMCLRSHVNLTETINSFVMITKAGVPANKVVAGITSYGRSFKMADAGCRTPQCLFTGSRAKSNAKKGRCTDTSGYISNAEIYEILSDSTRVNQHYVDGQSDSNILVYDNDEWVAYMDPEVRNRRVGLYKMMNLGGTTNWALDLESFHNPPADSGRKTWGGVFLEHRGDNDGTVLPHGDWTNLTCQNKYAYDPFDKYTTLERWRNLFAADAWDDVLQDWKTYKEKHGGKVDPDTFSDRIGVFLGHREGSQCWSTSVKNNCDAAPNCADFEFEDSGPGAWMVWNSLAQVNADHVNMYAAFDHEAMYNVIPQLKEFENTFAPVEEKDEKLWLSILFDIIGVGAPLAVGSAAKALAKGVKGLDTAEKVSGWAETITSTATGIAAEFKPEGTVNWKLEDQDKFTSYIGHVLWGWQDALSQSLLELFSGDDDSIRRLTTLIADGVLVGRLSNADVRNKPADPKDAGLALRERTKPNVTAAFYSSAIPAIWTASHYFPVILDTGYDCSDMSKGFSDLPKACQDGTIYQLAHVGSPCKKAGQCKESDWFGKPPGIDALGTGSEDWGIISTDDIIKGSAATYLHYGFSNGHAGVDASDTAALDALSDGNVRTPGVMHIPVCSPAQAIKSVKLGLEAHSNVRSQPNFPCDFRNALDLCGPSTFIDMTKENPAKLGDCMDIANQAYRNVEHPQFFIRADGSDQIVYASGSCQLRARLKKGADGGRNFYIEFGGQDIYDIIHDSVARFSGGHVVAARGEMSCWGDSSNGLPIEWFLEPS